MNVAFNPRRGLVIVRAKLYGPTGDMMLRLALDTGATRTTVNMGPLVGTGYDPALVEQRIQVTTGSGIQYAPIVTLECLRAIEHDRTGLSVLGLTLPPSAGIDGLLGLDFLRDRKLEVDFRVGCLTLQ